MRPVVQKVRLTELSSKSRRKICECKSLCEFGISMTTNNDGLILCWNDARRHMFDFIRILDEGGSNVTWSKSEEQFIIDHVKKRGGMVRGINREIAEALCKPLESAKSKTRRMKKAGLI